MTTSVDTDRSPAGGAVAGGSVAASGSVAVSTMEVRR
jgi:hypothetical protein